jgi:hypothetical protein
MICYKQFDTIQIAHKKELLLKKQKSRKMIEEFILSN